MAKRYLLVAVLLVVACSIGVSTFGARAQEPSVNIDVQHYVIDAQLVPSEQLLRARADVVFVPAGETRSAVFELNGSLAVKRITRVAGPVMATTTTPPAGSTPSRKETSQKKSSSSTGNQSGQSNPSAARVRTQSAQPGELQFIQDNRESMNVRVDLGTVVPAGRPVTLRFEYEGALESAQGGPIQTARLAYVGEQVSYLFYAARWFPFHNYAADRATYDIRITVPKGFTVVGYSESPVSPTAGATPDSQTFAFTSKTPTLPGNIAAAKYVTNSTKAGGFRLMSITRQAMSDGLSMRLRSSESVSSSIRRSSEATHMEIV